MYTINQQSKDVRLLDPLSETTRKVRRILLGLSMLGIFFVEAGVLPTKIDVLGVALSTSDQNSFLYLMSVGLFYFTISFFIYALSDFIAWKKSVIDFDISEYDYHMKSRDNDPVNPELYIEAQKYKEKNKFLLASIKPLSFVRATFEFLLPFVVGTYSIIMMIHYANTNM